MPGFAARPLTRALVLEQAGGREPDSWHIPPITAIPPKASGAWIKAGEPGYW